MYDLSDTSKCVGRVPHFLDSVAPTLTQSGRQQLGWLDCTSSNVLKFRFRNQNPAPPTTSVTYKYYKLTPRRLRDQTLFYYTTYAVGQVRCWQMAQFRFVLGIQDLASPSAATINGASVMAVFNGDLITWVGSACDGTTAFPPIIFQFSSPTTIDGYRWATANSAWRNQDFIAWVLEGSNTGVDSSYVVIDTQDAAGRVVPNAGAQWTGIFRLNAATLAYPTPLYSQSFVNGNTGPVMNSVYQSINFRFLQFKVLAIGAGGDNVEIYELQFFSRGEQVLPSNCKQAAGSEMVSHEPSKACDGSLGTLWAIPGYFSPSFDHALLIDFGTTRQIDSYRIVRSDTGVRGPVEWVMYGTNTMSGFTSCSPSCPPTGPYYYNADWTLVDASIGMVDPYTGGLTRVMPFALYMAQDNSLVRQTHTPWYRLEVVNPTTDSPTSPPSEFIVEAFYRNLAPASSPSCMTSCGVVSCSVISGADAESSSPGMVVFNIVNSTHAMAKEWGPSLSYANSTSRTNIAQFSMTSTTSIATLVSGEMYWFGYIKTTPSNIRASIGTLIPQTFLGRNPIIKRTMYAWIGLNTETKTIWAWGGQAWGEQGDGGSNRYATYDDPHAIVGSHTNVFDFCTGGQFACLLKSTGSGTTEMWCWGRGDGCSIGDNTCTPINMSPTKVYGGINDFTNIWCTGEAVIARRANGDMYGHGYWYYLPFSGNSKTYPTIISGIQCNEVEMRASVTFCKQSASSLLVWGTVAAGSTLFGDNTAYPSGGGKYTPSAVTLPGGVSIKTLCKGDMYSSHMCFIDTNDYVYMWGSSGSAELGGLSWASNVGPWHLIKSDPLLPTLVFRQWDIPYFSATKMRRVFNGPSVTCFEPLIAPQYPGQIKCFGSSTNGQTAREDAVQAFTTWFDARALYFPGSDVTSQASSYDPSQVFFSQLVRPVGNLPSADTADFSKNLFRIIWSIGGTNDILAGVNVQVFHSFNNVGNSRTCGGYLVSSSLTSLTRFVEMGRSLSDNGIFVFRTTGIDSKTTAYTSSLTQGAHRFIGPQFMCGCDYEPMAGDDGVCIKVNECLNGNNTCVQGNSKCVDYGPLIDGYDCICIDDIQTVRTYDAVAYRTIRTASDVNPVNNVEINHCVPTPVFVTIANQGLIAGISNNTNSTNNYTFTLYETDLRHNKNLGMQKFITTNIYQQSVQWIDKPEVAIQRMLPNHFYALQITTMVKNISNPTGPLVQFTIFDRSIPLSCGCQYDTKYIPFQTQRPREDDGRPLFTLLEQRLGLMYGIIMDDSKCDSSYSFYRLTLLPTTSDFSPVSNKLDRPLVNIFSDSVTALKIIPHQLSVEFSMSKVQTGTCGSTFGPMVLDDIAIRSLQVGSRHAYCSQATGNTEGNDNYYSDYGCFPKIHAVNWEARFIISVVAGFPRDFGVVRDVTLEWIVYAPSLTSAPLDQRTNEKELSSYLQFGRIVARGTAFTGKTTSFLQNGDQGWGSEIAPGPGQAYIHVSVDPRDYPEISQTTQLVIGVVPSKVDQVDDEPPTNHDFLCNEPFRPCGNFEPSFTMMSHLSFDIVHTEIRDITFVKVSGKIFIGGTSDVDACRFRDGAKVCAYAYPGRDVATPVQFDCEDSDINGEYSLAVNMHSKAVIYVDYAVPDGSGKNHTFAAVGTYAGQGSAVTVKTGTNNIAVDFMDTTTDILFVDIAAGACGLRVTNNVTVSLSRVTVGACSHYFSYSLQRWSNSMTRFYVTVPASKWEVFPIVGTTVDNDAGSATDVTTYLAEHYRGENYQVIDLSKGWQQPTSNSTTTNATSSCDWINNITCATEFQSTRTLFYRFDVKPDTEISIYQNNIKRDLSQDTCWDSSAPVSIQSPISTRQLWIDTLQHVEIHVDIWQTFFSGRCDNVPGTGKIFNQLAGVGNFPCVEGCSTRSTVVDLGNGKFQTYVLLAGVSAKPLDSKPFARYVSYYFYTDAGLVMKPGLQQVRAVAFFVMGVVPPSPGSGFDVVHHVIDTRPIAIIRDPPGGSSYSWHESSNTNVVLEFDNIEIVETEQESLSIDAGFNFDNKLCLGPSVGVSALTCLPVIHTDITTSTTPGATSMAKVTKHQATSSSVSFGISWTATTSSLPAYAGPMSDLFLIMTTPIYFVETFTIVPASGGNMACAGGNITRSLSVKVGNPDLSFITREAALRHVKPLLEYLQYNTYLDNWDIVLNTQPQFVAPPSQSPTATIPDLSTKKYFDTKKGIMNMGKANEGNEKLKGRMGRRILMGLDEQAMGELNVKPRAGRILVTDSRSFDPLAVEGLWGDETLRADVRAQLKGLPQVISFVGGGSSTQYTYDEDTEDTVGGTHVSQTDTLDMNTNLGGAISVVGIRVGVSYRAGRDWRGTHDKEFGTKTGRKRAVSGFQLSDPDFGDSFNVEVARDLRYGTFWFNTTAGYSSCAPEPNTVSREVPYIEVLTFPAGPSASWDNQIFTVLIRNDGFNPHDKSEARNFALYIANLAELKDDLSVTVDGSALFSTGTVIEDIEAKTSYTFIVSVTRGSRFFYSQSIKLGLRSACEENAGIPHAATSRVVATLNVEWYRDCPSLGLLGLAHGKVDADPVIVINAEENQVVDLVVQNAHPSGNTLLELMRTGMIKDAYFQILESREFGWSTLLDPATNDLVNLTKIESPSSRFATFLWDFSGPVFNNVMKAVSVRAIVKCQPQEGNPDPTSAMSITSSVSILIDKVRPILLRTSPSGAGVFPTSPIMFVFSETIKCSPQPQFTVTVSIWAPGATEAELIVHDSDADSPVIVVCSGDMVTVGFTFKETAGRTLTRNDLMGRHIVVELGDNVRDVAGNKVISNIPQPHEHSPEILGKVRVEYDTLSFDYLNTWYEALYLVIPNDTLAGGYDTIRAGLIHNLKGSVDVESLMVTKVDVLTQPGYPIITAVMRQNPEDGARDLVSEMHNLTHTDGTGYFFSVGGRFDVLSVSNEHRLIALQNEHRLMMGKLDVIHEQGVVCDVGGVMGELVSVKEELVSVKQDLNVTLQELSELKSLVLQLISTGSGLTNSGQPDKVQAIESNNTGMILGLAIVVGVVVIVLAVVLRRAVKVGDDGKGKRQQQFEMNSVVTSANPMFVESFDRVNQSFQVEAFGGGNSGSGSRSVEERGQSVNV
jgi:hypothetical protein